MQLRFLWRSIPSGIEGAADLDAIDIFILASRFAPVGRPPLHGISPMALPGHSTAGPDETGSPL
jgi:hypothetical protein